MNNRKTNNVNTDMDSGLGSDEDRRGSRTKEEKQLHNQQLLSGCFIDAASLSDDADLSSDQRQVEERRQGALVFQNSIPQFSMLQMEAAACHPEPGPDPYTPYNSIVQLDTGDSNSNKSSMGFYVDLSQVPDIPPTALMAKKNIFSMTIDFEGPKKDKPIKLSSSYSSQKKCKPTTKCDLSSSVGSKAGTSQDQRQNLEVLSASLVKNLSFASSKSSSEEASDKNVVEKSEEEPLGEANLVFECEEAEADVEDVKIPPCDEERKSESMENEFVEARVEGGKSKEPKQACPQFVRLSDLECQRPKMDVNFIPRMSRSIPESHWVESPFLMSRSACYRSAPHPIEPEPAIPEHNSDSDSILTNSSVSQPKKAVRRLGTDLLRMFLEEIGPDVIVEVDGHKLKAHKCILASRCQYFAALLSGNWLEKSGNVISLQGFSYESVYFALCHIYSGAAHVPDSISLVELASLADMLGLEGLKEVVEHALKQRHCHNFHKPCAGCCTGVLEVLPLSAAYGLDDLYQRCLQWITQHFVRVWPSRAFASLPRELREKCYQQHVIHMTPDKVLETLSTCDKVLATLPVMRWAEPVSQLVLQLADACHLYHRQHFGAVLGSASFHALDAGLGFAVCEVEEQMLRAAKNLGVDQACKSYARCCRMLDARWSRPFADLLNKIKIQLEQCLVGQADRLIRSNAWLRLDTVFRSRIKELTPLIEPQSRLPRAAPSKAKKPPSSGYSPLLSSSDSSRNSSPGVNQGRLPGGSPSLRRSLLLAAKTPQVPPSPSTARRSTLTQPTAASQARSVNAPSKHVKNAVPVSNRPSPRTAANANIRPSSGGSVRPTSSTTNPGGGGTQARPNSASYGSAPNSKRTSTVVSRNSSLGKKDTPVTVNQRRSDVRSSSPFKTVVSPKKLDSKMTSPIKAHLQARSPSPMRKNRAKPKNELAKAAVPEVPRPPQPSMQRSDTFLKEEPTVLERIT